MAGDDENSGTKPPEEADSEDAESGKPRLSLWERLKPLHDRVASRPSSGFLADKAFNDGLNDEQRLGCEN